MAITLVVNPGSTSKKYALFDDERQLTSMRLEDTGEGFGVCRQLEGETQTCDPIEAKTYQEGVSLFLKESCEAGILQSPKAVHAVGVRVVAPSMAFAKHVPITDEYIAALEKHTDVAPIHIPATVREIRATQAAVTNTSIYGISDSAFHTSIPSHRKRFGIARQDANEFGIERFGYHGLSVASVARRTGTFFGVQPDRVVVLHVGGGVSATAIHYEESVDTSMGYSPASGIMMGTRVGRFDADALLALMARKGMRSVTPISEYLNTQCGFRGTVGYSDLRLVLKEYTEGNADASEALQMFRYQMHREIGGHIAVLGGLDAFVFTGTAVERNPFIRSYLLDGLAGFGLVIDGERNDSLVGREGMIHSDRAEVPIGVMKSDEMREIARAVGILAHAGSASLM